MWGTSSPDDKLAGDVARATEATKIAGRRSDRLLAGKLSPRNFGLLQQNRHQPDEGAAPNHVCLSRRSRLNAKSPSPFGRTMSAIDPDRLRPRHRGDRYLTV